jgi:hypothetical protein
LLALFFERAVKDKDVPSGTLCCKLEERLALLLGLDHPTTQRVDVYQVEQQQQPTGHEQIRAAIMRVARGPNWQPPDAKGNGNAVGALSDLSDDKPNN